MRWIERSKFCFDLYSDDDTLLGWVNLCRVVPSPMYAGSTARGLRVGVAADIEDAKMALLVYYARP